MYARKKSGPSTTPRGTLEEAEKREHEPFSVTSVRRLRVPKELIPRIRERRSYPPSQAVPSLPTAFLIWPPQHFRECHCQIRNYDKELTGRWPNVTGKLGSLDSAHDPSFCYTTKRAVDLLSHGESIRTEMVVTVQDLTDMTENVFSAQLVYIKKGRNIVT